jgi:hypothetical protein
MKYPIRSFIKMFSLTGIFALMFLFSTSCGEEDCEYTAVPDVPIAPVIPIGCDLANSIVFSTGIDVDGNLIAPGDGVTDPYWRVLNEPPLYFCEGNPLVATINGSAYVVNFADFPIDGWVNQPTASTLAPVDLGTTNGFGCDNAVNGLGIQVPYVFERSFCVLKDTHVNLDFTFKGDDQIYFQLIDNFTNTVLSTSINYIYPNLPFAWTETALALPAGSYSIRGYLINTSSVVLGFSLSGSMATTDGDLAISNNTKGCCENNTISVLNILDSNCNGVFDTVDTFGVTWTFNVRDTSNAVIRTGVTNDNGNVFFSGLADGTYTVQAIPQNGYTTNVPVGGSISVTVSGNNVQIVEFYNCN